MFVPICGSFIVRCSSLHESNYCEKRQWKQNKRKLRWCQWFCVALRVWFDFSHSPQRPATSILSRFRSIFTAFQLAAHFNDKKSYGLSLLSPAIKPVSKAKLLKFKSLRNQISFAYRFYDLRYFECSNPSNKERQTSSQNFFSINSLSSRFG